MTYCDWGSEKTLAGQRRAEGRSRGAAARDSWWSPAAAAGDSPASAAAVAGATRELCARARVRRLRHFQVHTNPCSDAFSLSLVPCGIRLIA